MILRRLIAATTLLTGVFTAWNLAGEAYVIGSLNSAIGYAVAWLVFPLWNMFMAGRRKRAAELGVRLFLSIIYMSICLMYALNGSTAGKQGVQHMHLIFVPVLFFIIAAVSFIPLSEARARQRSADHDASDSD